MSHTCICVIIQERKDGGKWVFIKHIHFLLPLCPSNTTAHVVLYIEKQLDEDLIEWEEVQRLM